MFIDQLCDLITLINHYHSFLHIASTSEQWDSECSSITQLILKTQLHLYIRVQRYVLDKCGIAVFTMLMHHTMNQVWQSTI